jgi:hypothetical protein
MNNSDGLTAFTGQPETAAATWQRASSVELKSPLVFDLHLVY